MKLCNSRNKIIKLFEDKNIMLSTHAYDAKSEPRECDGVNESEQKFDESIGERVKLRTQKADDKINETGDEQPETTDMADLESEESASERRKQKLHGLKILTPQQIYQKLFITADLSISLLTSSVSKILTRI